MERTFQSAVDCFRAQLDCHSSERHTGRLDVQTASGLQHSLYLSLGHVVWVAGGMHPVRRWLRQPYRFCPDVRLNQMARRSDDIDAECWDYQVLVLLQQNRPQVADNAVAIVEGIVGEALFDIIQDLELGIQPDR